MEDEQKTLAKVYDPRQVEKKWYDFWEREGFFHQEVEETEKPFAIVMPPPNVTGALHLGHALDNTLQDILTRWKRMQGYNTLWLPGTDHAGIATQARVEEQLDKEGQSKNDLGRDKFLDRVWDWKREYGGKITQQLRLLGSSCDWQRERFTMDEGCSRAVREVFVSLYEKGLIFRGDYMINWCPKCRTTISDIEVEHMEQPGGLYSLRYPLTDGSGEIVVATTRPETMLGDTAVAVHPEDERYQTLIGKKVLLPLVGREIPVIADSYVDPEFGSGAVKITPAHDPNDFEIGLRHELPSVVIIGLDGQMTAEAGEYAGMSRYECRDKIVADLNAGGFLVDAKDYTHAVGHCYRCDTVIEPLVSRQWFVKMEPLAKPAIQAVLDGRTRFIPERFTKIYLNWLENIRDWCISRQLWWGHRIPVWYCQECGQEICARQDPVACPACGSGTLEQDMDVLDTWFSSALWPFSTMGWPEETSELRQFYPTSVLVTGRDIIFFWVARMIFMAMEHMQEVPFSEVFIHGLVLDSQGRKMSKSLGNGVDPIEVIDEYGADALRFMLITGNTPGNDLRFRLERLENSRNFANKIWNASRFALMNLEDYQPLESQPRWTVADKWILSRYNNTVIKVTANLEKYELGEAARELYDFIWTELCDWYLELIKPRLYGKEDELSRRTAQQVLYYVLEGTMRLLHPLMPFITEEIWQYLPGDGKTIMTQPWPESQPELEFPLEVQQMDMSMDTIRSVRNIRAEMNLPPGKEIKAMIVAEDRAGLEALELGQGYIKNLAKVAELELLNGAVDQPAQAATGVVKGAIIYIPLAGLIDFDQEIQRLTRELQSLKKDLQQVERKLSNQSFLKKAPAEVVAKENEKKDEFEGKIRAIALRLKTLDPGR